MIPISCDCCSRALNLPESLLGRQVRCPHCSGTFEARLRGKPMSAVQAIAPVAAPPFLDLEIEDTNPPPDALPLAEPVTAEPTAMSVPSAPASRPYFAAIPFAVRVELDTEGLGGCYDGRVDNDGLRLELGNVEMLWLPATVAAQYLGGSRLEIQHRQRTLVLDVTGPYNLYRDCFARDLVRYFQGELALLDPHPYHFGWYMYAPAALPFLLPVLALGGCIWAGLGPALAVVNFAILQQSRWNPLARVLANLAISGFAIFACLVVMVFTFAGAFR